jgi:hypothetical protein
VSHPHLASAPAGGAFPLKRAEELLATLPGVIAARIMTSDSGVIDEIHVLTSADVAPKQTVRNIESALIAHFGLRVDHRKISVATTVEPQRPTLAQQEAQQEAVQEAAQSAASQAAQAAARRRIYFEDVEVRRSRVKGVLCRVTLRKGDEQFIGEAEGPESERSRVDLAARATILAIGQAEGGGHILLLEGTKILDAFDREFVFVGVTARLGRGSVLLAGTCEVKESAETASALAVLDATNRWIARDAK